MFFEIDTRSYYVTMMSCPPRAVINDYFDKKTHQHFLRQYSAVHLSS